MRIFLATHCNRPLQRSAPRWQEALFAAMERNAAHVTDFFALSTIARGELNRSTVDVGQRTHVAQLAAGRGGFVPRCSRSGGGVLARASDGKTWDSDFEGEIQPYKDDKRKKTKFSIKAGEKVGRDIGLGKWGTLDPDNEGARKNIVFFE